MSGERVKLTKAQQRALEMIQRRTYPAGEPREGWFIATTLAVLFRKGLIEARPDSTGEMIWQRTPILDLTDAGRAALAGDRP